MRPRRLGEGLGFLSVIKAFSDAPEALKAKKEMATLTGFEYVWSVCNVLIMNAPR